jgi:DNA-binding LytR/AlgR family response regulator
MDILIIEDEILAADRLEKMLLEVEPSANVVAKIGSIKSSVEWLSRNRADLIFLDIQLTDGLSFSIFEQVPVQTPIIFTTAFEQYAIKAFELNSISYLLKPIKKKELQESIQKFKSLKSVFSVDVENLLSSIRGEVQSFKKRFIIQITDKYKKIDIEEVAYFYSQDKSVYLKTKNNQVFPVDYTLDKLLEVLNPEVFFRINRKYIVNIDSITKMIAYSKRQIKLELTPMADEDLDTIVSVDRVSNFKKWMDR